MMRKPHQPVLFQRQEMRTTLELALIRELKQEISKLESTKGALLEHIKLFKEGRLFVFWNFGIFNADANKAVYAYNKGIADLQDLITKKLDPVIKSKKTELAGLENPSNQSQESNYCQEVLECRMQ